ncbi:MAG: hypothetical protein ACPGOY_10345 [Rhodospirillaceae bacterium]
MPYGKYAQSIAANAKSLNNGTHAGGLGSALSQGLAGWMMGKGLAEDREAKQAQRDLTNRLYRTTQASLTPPGPLPPEPLTPFIPPRPSPVGGPQPKGRTARLMETSIPSAAVTDPLSSDASAETPQVGAPLQLMPPIDAPLPRDSQPPGPQIGAPLQLTAERQLPIQGGGRQLGPQPAIPSPQGAGYGRQGASAQNHDLLRVALEMMASPSATQAQQAMALQVLNHAMQGSKAVRTITGLQASQLGLDPQGIYQIGANGWVKPMTLSSANAPNNSAGSPLSDPGPGYEVQ